MTRQTVAVAAFAIALSLSTVPAAAAADSVDAATDLPLLTSRVDGAMPVIVRVPVLLPVAVAPVLEQRVVGIAAPPQPVPVRMSRPAALIPLYGLTAGLQLADAHSTFKALDTGFAVEANPLVRNLADNRAALWAVKAGAAAATIYAAEKMWKRNRVGAVATLIAVNAAYAVVVAHNYRTARAGARHVGQ